MIEIRDLIAELTTLLSDQLGTYTFKSISQSTPAIWNSNEQFPESPDITGLECIVSRQPISSIKAIVGGYQRSISLAVTLKQWDISKTTLSAMDAVVTGLTLPLLITDIRQVLRDETLDNIETCTILMQEFELLTIR